MAAASYKLIEPDATAGEAEVETLFLWSKKVNQKLLLRSVSIVIGFLLSSGSNCHRLLDGSANRGTRSDLISTAASAR